MRSLFLAMLVALGMYFGPAEFVPNPRLSGFGGPEFARSARGEVIVGASTRINRGWFATAEMIKRFTGNPLGSQGRPPDALPISSLQATTPR